MKLKSLTVILALILSLSMQNCSTSGKATVRLNLGLPDNYAMSQKPSLFDRILSIFITNAYAQAPSNITGITVRVSGPGMEAFELNSPPVPYISVEVQAGNSRNILVLANIDPSGLVRRYRLWTAAQLGILCVAGFTAAVLAVRIHLL